jgi:NAD-dependent SIR2 family protein deacetylase
MGEKDPSKTRYEDLETGEALCQWHGAYKGGHCPECAEELKAEACGNPDGHERYCSLHGTYHATVCPDCVEKFYRDGKLSRG